MELSARVIVDPRSVLGKERGLTKANLQSPLGGWARQVVSEIYSSMSSDGWVGPPLIAIRTDSRYQAWTGSHRILVARRLKVQIPLLVVDVEALRQAGWSETKISEGWKHPQDLARVAPEAAELLEAQSNCEMNWRAELQKRPWNDEDWKSEEWQPYIDDF